MSVLDELTTLLPTRAATWIAGLTGLLVPAMFAAPHFLSPLMPEKILTFLSKHHDWVADPDIAASLKIDRALATFHLVELNSAGMIKTCLLGICFNDCPGRQIDQPGLAYLVSHVHL